MNLSVRVGYIQPEVSSLMGLYPQTAQRRPSIQYVPVPYRREKEAEQSKGEQRIAL